MPRPLVAIAVAFAAGIALSLWVDVSLTRAFYWLTSTAGGALIVYLLGKDDAVRRFTSWLLLAACLTAGLFWITLDRTTHQSRLLDDLHTHLYLTGTVAAEPQVYPTRIVYTLDATEVRQGNWREDLREKVQVVYYMPQEAAGQWAEVQDATAREAGPAVLSNRNASPTFAYGDVLRVFGQLDRPPLPRNPGEFDYRTYLARQGIFTRMAVDDPHDITFLTTGKGNPLASLALAAKHRAVAAIEAALPYPEAGVLQAMLFGDREKLDEEKVEAWQGLGVFHLFAVSGLHVGFLLVFILALTQLLGLGRWPKLIFGGLLLLFYAAVTGFTPSVSRAGIMAVMVLLGQALGEKTDFYTSLAAAALVILLANPQALFLSGFQMSFLATWGIVYLYPLIHDPLARVLAARLPGPWPGVADSIAVSTAAQVAVMPLVANYFNLISPGALLANLVVVPLAGLAVILGLMVFFAAQLSVAVGALFAYLAGALLSSILAILQFFAGLPGMVWPTPAPPVWAIALFLAGLVAARELWVRRGNSTVRDALRHWLPVAFTLTVAWVALFLVFSASPGHLQVTFLDVGQGSSIYIETPTGRHLLVDGGGVAMPLSGDFEVGEDIVEPFLVRQGVRRLDIMVSTHPDADHIQGLETVMAELPVSLAVTPPVEWFENGYTRFLELAAGNAMLAAAGNKEALGSSLAPDAGQTFSQDGRNTPVIPVTRGYRLQVDPSLEITVLHPVHSFSGTRSDDNNASLVLQLTYGEISFLLTGDIEAEAMQELVEQQDDLLASDVLLLPHHGSRYSLSPEFYAAVRPVAVVTQVGEHNTFGHPAPEVIAYWEQQGIPIYRTDRHGAVTFTTEGKNLWVEIMIEDPGR